MPSTARPSVKGPPGKREALDAAGEPLILGWQLASRRRTRRHAPPHFPHQHRHL